MKIVMYKQKVCGACSMVDSFIQNDLGLDVDERKLMFAGNKDVDNEVIKLGIMQSPAIVVYDAKNKAIAKVVGYNPSEIEELFVTAGRIS